MASSKDGYEKNFVPALPEVLWATPLVDGGATLNTREGILLTRSLSSTYQRPPSPGQLEGGRGGALPYFRTVRPIKPSFHPLSKPLILMAHASFSQPRYRLLFLLLAGLAFLGTRANAAPAMGLPTPPAAFAVTVTANPSALFFTAAERTAPIPQTTSITIAGVSSGHVTTITAPTGYEVSVLGAAFATSLQITGNFTFALAVQLKGNLPIGTFNGNLSLNGLEINVKLIPLKGVVSANPSFFPSTLFFSTQVGTPAAIQAVTINIAGLPATAKTLVKISGPFAFFKEREEVFFNELELNGSVSFTIPVQFTGGNTVGTFEGTITATGPDINTKTIPVKATVLAVPTPVVNPTSLSGFTAVAGVSTGAPKPFDLTVTGLPTQATAPVTVTAPTGYAISLSSNPATFLNALNLTPGAGKITTKVFVLLKTSNPVGTVKGDLSIKGSQINTKLLPLTGTVTAKPAPTLAVDKTSLSFATTTNKASAVQTYQLTASNLAGGATASVTAPTGFELRLGTAGTLFTPTLTVSSFNGGINATISVRLKSSAVVGTVSGNLTHSVAGLSKTISLTGQVKPAPSLTLNPTSLTGFATVKNQASPAKTYQFKALNLAAGVTATVTPPTGYELRLLNAGSFAATLTLTQSAAGTIDRTVEVRLKSQTTTGTLTGNITHAVAGISKTLSVSGTVAAPTLAITVSSLAFTAVKNQPSAAKTYTVSATKLAGGVTATVTASAAYEVRVQGTGSFVSTLTLTQTAAGTISRLVEVRLKAPATTGTITGSLNHAVAGLSKTVTLSASVKAALVATAPTLTTSPLATCQAVAGRPSWAQPWTIQVAGSAKNAVFSAETSADFEFVKQDGSVSGKFNFKADAEGKASHTVRVRLKGRPVVGPVSGRITLAGKAISTKIIPMGGVVSNKPTPIVNPASLSGFTAGQGTPSAAKSFVVSVSGLPAQGTILVLVTAPAGYAVGLSADPAAFAGSLSLTALNGAIANTTVFAVLKGNNPAGTISGNITVSGTEINTKLLPVSGTVTDQPAPTLTVDQTSLSFTTLTKQASGVQTYQLAGANLPAATAATVTAPPGYELRLGTGGNVFAGTLTVPSANGTLNATISVRLKARAKAGVVSGTLTHAAAGLSQTLSLSGTVNARPFLSVTPRKLSAFTTVVDQASAVKMYQVTAGNLAPGVTATTAAPDGFEIRLPGTASFSSQLALPQTAAGVINQPVEVRLMARATRSTFAGNITATVAGLGKTLPVSGTVTGQILLLPAAAAARQASGPVAASPESLRVGAFPNPATGAFTVTFEAPAGQRVLIGLTDAQGTLITGQELSSAGGSQRAQVSVRNQRPGVYLLRVAAGGQQQVVKVVLY